MMESYDPVKGRHVLVSSVQDVCAELAFIDVLETESEGGGDLRESVAIDILRPMSSRIELRFGADFLQKVAQNLFLDQEAAARNQEDSILELINVVAGRFLTNYFGPSTDIKLELPRLLYGQEENEGELICAARLDAEGLPLEATLRSVRYKY